MGRLVLSVLGAVALVLAARTLDPSTTDAVTAERRAAESTEQGAPAAGPSATAAPTTTTTAPPTTTTPPPEPPDITVGAAAWAVATPDGEVIAGTAPDERRPIASLAKLPLSLVTVDAITASTDHLVPPTAATAPGRRVGWSPSVAVTAEELLDGLLNTSGNDAAVTAAATIGGDDVALAAIGELGGDGIRDVAGVRSDTVASAREVVGWLAAVVERPALLGPLVARAGDPLPGQSGGLALGAGVPTFEAVKTSWSPAAGRGLAALMRFGDEERLVVVLDAEDPTQAAIDAYVAAWWAERTAPTEAAGTNDLAGAASTG